MHLVLKLAPGSQRAIDRWAQRGKELRPVIKQAAAQGAQLLAAEIVRKDLHGYVLDWRTGMLAQSVVGRVAGSGDTIIVSVGVWKAPAAKYARIHEKGGLIRPVKGKYLAIPLDAARTAGGRSRFPRGPRQAEEKYPEMFLLKRPGKDSLLCIPKRVGGRRKGRVKGIIPLFVLTRYVRLPPRYWLSGGTRRHVHVCTVTVERAVHKLLAA